ncbi:MAG TPA: hypothetical protein VK841_00290 [Polyangiaceae bacterium]|jgi:hypothetical protein|nr:hypothetical protein [Polyangiaceae bacterium]
MTLHIDVVGLVERIRSLGKAPSAVRIGGDAVLSMGGRGVGGRDVGHALVNATTAEEQGPDVIIMGPTIDGEVLRIVARINEDGLHVSNVVL